jgi:dihydrofolate reductase
VRNLVVVEYVSLDGVIQAPGHPHEDREGGFTHGGWTGPAMQEHRRYLGHRFRAAGAFLFGRITYEIWARYWPAVLDDSDDIAHALNTLPKYVASRTLGDATWPDTTVIHSDVGKRVRSLKAEPGGDVYVFGSSDLVRTLMEHDLIDEYQLWLHPIVIGGGKQLSKPGTPTTSLQLVDAQISSGGLVALTYAPARLVVDDVKLDG